MLAGYSDKQLCVLLTYGFPINGRQQRRYKKPTLNHAGANNFAVDIERYLDKELSLGAVLGPYRCNPFPCSPVFSPLNTTEKKASTEHRVILDLSFPTRVRGKRSD